MSASAVLPGDSRDIHFRLGVGISIDAIRPGSSIKTEKEHCVVDGGVEAIIDDARTVSCGVETIYPQSPEVPDECGLLP